MHKQSIFTDEKAYRWGAYYYKWARAVIESYTLKH